MAFSPLTPLPPAPARTDPPEVFIPKADAFVAALATLQAELNTFQVEVAAVAASLGVSSPDAELAAIAALNSAANKGIYFSGPGAAALFDQSAFGRTINNLADATALRTLAGVYSTAQVDAMVTGLLEFKGTGNCAGNPNYPAALKGDAYVVSGAGRIGGGAGKLVDVGDWYVAIADNAGGTEAAVGASWTVLEHNIDPTMFVPTGTVIHTAMAAAPVGFLACDGAAVSRATHAALYAAIGDTYGAGDGSTTFNVPDLRGEFVRGHDGGRGVDPGRGIGTTQADELKSHSHNLRLYADTQIAHDGSVEGDRTVQAAGGSTGGYIDATGGTETRPRNVALFYCIKT